MNSKEINEYARQLLDQIFIEYGAYLKNPDYVKNLLQMEELVVVEKDGSRWQKEHPNSKIPLAHGGRTFNDNKIHLYPFISKDKSKNYNGVIIHELFHYFLRPDSQIKEDDIENKLINDYSLNNVPGISPDTNFNSFLTEGIVDYFARTYGMNHEGEQFKKYQSNYGLNVIYIRKLLDNGVSIEDLFKLSDIDLVNKAGKDKMKSIQEEILKKDSIEQKLIAKISETYGDNKHKENIERFLINKIAYAKNLEEIKTILAMEIEKSFPNDQRNAAIINEINSTTIAKQTELTY